MRYSTRLFFLSVEDEILFLFPKIQKKKKSKRSEIAKKKKNVFFAKKKEKYEYGATR
jgi:hypothetical protein